MKWVALACLLAMPAAAQTFSATGPDAAGYGSEAGYPIGPPGHTNDQQFMVGSYSHLDAVLPSSAVAPALTPSPWRRAPGELSLSYSFGGVTHTLADYLASNPVTGLLIARGDTILFERYQYGRTDHDRFTSQSMAKTLVGTMIGIAINDGLIKSVDDPAERYAAGLAGTELGRTPIRALLHMASGVQFTENYGGDDDNAKLGRALWSHDGTGAVAAVRRFDTRTGPPDTVWHYAGLNTEVLGLVLAGAAHMGVAEYLQARIWQPMGAEAAASWATDTRGQTVAYCCFNATLRDWARFGRLLANDGVVGGRAVVPRQWIIDATTVAAPFLAPGKVSHDYGYGYQTWIMDGPSRMFALHGIHGQRLFIDPASKLVMVHTAVRVPATRGTSDAELLALWHALVQQAGQ